MISNKLPSVLQQPHGNSLSVERVLKQAIDLINCAEYPNRNLYERSIVCEEDLQTLLRSIDRG